MGTPKGNFNRISPLRFTSTTAAAHRTFQTIPCIIGKQWCNPCNIFYMHWVVFPCAFNPSSPTFNQQRKLEWRHAKTAFRWWCKLAQEIRKHLMLRDKSSTILQHRASFYNRMINRCANDVTRGGVSRARVQAGHRQRKTAVNKKCNKIW